MAEIMALLLIKHSVFDFDKWYDGYQSLDHIAYDYGCTSKRIWRAPSEPNSILVAMDFETEKQARDYLRDDEIEAAKKDGRLTDSARVEFYNTV